MGFDFEKMANNLGRMANDFGDAMEKKRNQLEKNARKEFQQKARNASYDELIYNLERYEAKGNYVAVEEIRKELDRRG